MADKGWTLMRGRNEAAPKAQPFGRPRSPQAIDDDDVPF